MCFLTQLMHALHDDTESFLHSSWNTLTYIFGGEEDKIAIFFHVYKMQLLRYE